MIGFSDDPTPATAGSVATDIATGGAGAMLVAFTPDHVPRVSDLWRAIVGRTGVPVVGMSVGAVLGPDGWRHRSAVVALPIPGTVEVRRGTRREPVDLGAGETAIVLAEPFSHPVAPLLAAAREGGTSLVGGYASAALEPGGNRLLLPDGPVVDGVVAVLVQPPPRVRVVEGCEPAGGPGTVTAVDGDRVSGIDGRPAVDLLADRPDLLGIVRPDGSVDVRGVGPPDGESMPVDGGVAVGQVVQPLRFRADRGAAELAAVFHEGSPGPAAVWCCVRRDRDADAAALADQPVWAVTTAAEFSGAGPAARLSTIQAVVALW